MNKDEKIMKKIESGREYRNMKLEIRDDQENTNDDMIVEGYATTFDDEYLLYWIDEKTAVKEVIDPNAFDDCDMSDVIFQYDHEGRVFARNKNDTLDLNVDEHGLKVVAKLGGTDIGRQLYQEIEGGYTDKMSYGFIVSNDDVKEEKVDGVTYYLRRILGISKLFDVSAVSIPANDYTEISARHACDGVIASIQAECLEVEKRKKAKELKRKVLNARIKMMKGRNSK